MRRSTFRKPTVGEDITCPALIESAGRIRIRSERAAIVADWFGLQSRGSHRASSSECKKKRPPTRGMSRTTDARSAALAAAIPSILPGTIMLIAGASGAGKSTVLRAARAAAEPGRRWIDLMLIDPPEVPLVDCFGQTDLREVLELLGRVGLSEAWSYLRTPAELSEGQRWRFKLALALFAAREGADRPIIACDEFAAVLDRVTAMVVAHRLRRAIRAMPHAAAVVATSHEDIEPALAADVVIRCDYGVWGVDGVEPSHRVATRSTKPRSSEG